MKTEENAVPVDAFADFTGATFRPDDPGYAQARGLWNGMLDLQPALIARCAGVDDVQTAVRFAAEHDLLVAVRGGGHNVAGTASADGALVIDLSEMNQVTVNPSARTVRAGGGARWVDVDAATQRHGLATPGGLVSDTGVGGLTLGGGIGWLRRKHGLSCDNLIGARLVTADGTARWVDGNSAPDVLWGLRGGGGNFGVVTEFEFRLHHVGPEVYVGFVFYHGDQTREALRFYRDWTAKLAEEVSSFAICGTVPEADDFPSDTWGEPYILLASCAATTPETGRQLVQPTRDLGNPIADLSAPMPYVELQKLLDADYPSGELRYYWKSLHLPELSDEIIGLAERWSATRPSPLSTLDIWHLGGAVGQVPADATAFGDRSDPYLLGVESNWALAADDAANLAWTRACVAAFRHVSSNREYLNFPGFLEDPQQTLRAAHGERNYLQLAELKRRLDPNNLFRLHQNVPPAQLNHST